jgi:hypothetical protein
MKKKLVLALLMVTLLAGGAFAQEWYNSYAPGIDGSTILANIGIGFGLSPYSLLKMSVPPLSASVEYAGLPIPLSVGGYFGFARYKWDFFGLTSDESMTILSFGARAAWHFNFLQNLDAYGGVALGYQVNVYSVDMGPWGYGSGAFDFGFFVGARYFFTDIIGVYLEAGYSPLSLISAGLSLKF